MNEEDGGVAREDLQALKDEFNELLMDEPALKEGQTWYLVNVRWYRQFEEYVGLDRYARPGPHPGPIDNQSLLEPNGALKMYARERMDFVVRSEQIWKRLVQVFGGGPELPRKVIATMWNQKIVETHPLRLQFIKSSDMNTVHWGNFSKAAKVKEMRNEMCAKMGLNVDDVRLWDFHNDQKLKLLEDPLATLSEERILDNQKLLFEEKLANGKWAKLATKRDREMDRYHQERSDPGLCGLMNLGNTCFMNSGLQCLSNTQPLSDYVVSARCDTEINRTNPLGTKGELTTEFADLLQDMWSGRMSSVAPRDFKWKLERFAPQFSGWQQHDSHELLAFLLDGLHEDLNRVTKKPYFETNEFEGMPETEAAVKSWGQHIARNNSFITDWFHGQLRSEVTCNVCPRVSKVFDPFMYLSVPLPEAKTRSLEVVVWTQDFTKRPTKYVLDIPKHGTVQDLVQVVASTHKTNVRLMHVSDVYSQRFFKHYKRDEASSAITDRDTIFVVEGVTDLERSSKDDAPVEENPLTDVQLLWKEEKMVPGWGVYPPSVQRLSIDPPLIVSVPKTATYKQLYDFLATKLARFFNPPKEEPQQQQQGGDIEAGGTGGESAASDGQTGEGTTTINTNSNKRLFKICLTDRYGQLSSSRDIEDDEVINLRFGDAIVLMLESDGCVRGAFDRKEALEVIEHESCNVQAGQGDSAITLDQCITLFGEKEQLSEEDPWYCSQCKEHRRAYKKFDLWQLPKLLIIQLKRFSYRSKHWREKIESLVHFPLEGLDLTAHIKGPLKQGETPLYDLYAISNHYGALGGGHYTAFCRNVNLGKWYKFDDSSVAEVHDPKSVITSAAYVLFYQRRDTLPPVGYRVPTPAKLLLSESANAANAPAEDEEEGEVRNTVARTGGGGGGGGGAVGVTGFSGGGVLSSDGLGESGDRFNNAAGLSTDDSGQDDSSD